MNPDVVPVPPAVQRRIVVTRWWWQEFDALQASHQPGTPWLSRLVPWTKTSLYPSHDEGESDPVFTEWCLTPLSSDLNGAITDAFRTVMHRKAPGVLVSRVLPAAGVARILGPIVDFWDMLGQTVWGLTDGPYATPNVLESFAWSGRASRAMTDLGCPPAEALLDDLVAAQERDGLPLRWGRHGPGVGNTFRQEFEDQESPEPRLPGCPHPDDWDIMAEPHVSYETWRDIVAGHRKTWAEEHLDVYLLRRFSADVLAFSTAHEELVEKRGRAPTVLQLTRIALEPANVWFDGDTSALCTAAGIVEAPGVRAAERLMPKDPWQFGRDVCRELLGNRNPSEALPRQAPGDYEDSRGSAAGWLAYHAYFIVQLLEAGDDHPLPSDISRTEFGRHYRCLGRDAEDPWTDYVDAVRAVLALRTAPTVEPARPAVAAPAV